MIALVLAASLAQAPLDAPLRFDLAGFQQREETYTGGPIPENARLANRDNGALFLGGALTFAVPYSLSAALALTFGVIVLAFAEDAQLISLAIPVGGPFLAMALASRTGTSGNALMWIHGINGAIQVTGVTMMIVAAVTKRTVVVFEDEPRQVSFAPFLTGDGGGLAARMAW